MRTACLLALVALGCVTAPAGTDGGVADAAPDARDGGPPRMDAYAPPYDAGPSGLAPSGDVQLVTSDCSMPPRLAWNGIGWAVWWPGGCDAMQEIDAIGVPGARLAIPALPVGAPFDPHARLDAVVFAHGAYGLAARGCSPAGPCSDEHFASLAPSGTASPWVAAPPGGFVGLAGWDDRDDWLTVEGRATGSTFAVTSVRRDASFAPTSEVSIGTTSTTPFGDVYATPHAALAWWGVAGVTSMGARSLGPDGAALGAPLPFPYFLDDADALGETLIVLDVLPFSSPMPPPRGIGAVDPQTAVQAWRAPIVLAEQANAPRVAVMPERGLAGLCWTHPTRTGPLELYVQLADLATHALVGLPTRVEANDPIGHDCGWSGSAFVVVWGETGTRARAYQLAR